jgi:hypothetical protein
MTSSEERTIASEVSHELTRLLGALAPEALMTNQTVVEETFTRVFDRHGVTNESSAVRILGRASKALARNFKFAERNRRLDAAMRALQ